MAASPEREEDLSPEVTLIALSDVPTDSARQSDKGEKQFQPSPTVSIFSQARRSSVAKTQQWIQGQSHARKSSAPIVAFFALGLCFSVAHCILYAGLDGKLVGSPAQQENNLRFGTAFAFLSQISLTASVWHTYTLWVWRSVKKEAWPISTLNSMFGADMSVLSLLNVTMMRRFKAGLLIAMLAWSLMFPPFFTTGTLFVNPSVDSHIVNQTVPYPSIANSTDGHLYSFSPSDEGDSSLYKNITTRLFVGPRTILTLLGTAAASQAQILPINPPYNHSSFSIDFFGPAVQCLEAGEDTRNKISSALQAKMSTTTGNATETINAYYGFVPSFDAQGNVTPLPEMRYQWAPHASNELWMVFQRYIDTTKSACDYREYYQVCKLWNATYTLDFAWDNGFQNITGSRALMHEVAYPNDTPPTVSDMAQHAYSAYFWVLANQAVGSFGWFNVSTAEGTNKSIGMIASPIQHNALLGSSDLDVFFDFNEARGACQMPYANLTVPRQQDKDRAKSRRLDELIEELSFNMTISLMHNDLLTHNATRPVTVIEDVNRYGYNQWGLFAPYMLSCVLTLVTVVVGAITGARHGPLPGKDFKDILATSGDPEVAQLARRPHSEGLLVARPMDSEDVDGLVGRPLLRFHVLGD
ncbi:hypothetical protein B0T19DRAFT_434807 [Cercophora scortea]|uniref:Uncharacterized protein n=1 Tax=Cercophora scortea TaxID=314031 RepID=A0AAE0M3I0_9PEZI|nr:hypothetical protein B0T19DRAFT_434807 [Cercophora scortea]